MDTGQATQTGITSPTRGNRTRTIREYEETISEFKKENFDLKLKIFMYEEALKKHPRKDGQSPTKDPVEVIVSLKSESESLQNELCYKDKLLQDALEKVKKHEVDFNALEKKYAELQSQLSTLSGLPSKEEFLSLIDEKEKLEKHTEYLEKELSEKEDEIYEANQRIEFLANENENLEQKIKKRSIAIQSLVFKNYKEEEKLPEELRNVVMSATLAAKNGNEDDLYIAIKSINTKLIKMMDSVQSLNKSAEKENIESPQAKCLKEEFLERRSLFLPSQVESYTELSHVKVRKES